MCDLELLYKANAICNPFLYLIYVYSHAFNLKKYYDDPYSHIPCPWGVDTKNNTTTDPSLGGYCKRLVKGFTRKQAAASYEYFNNHTAIANPLAKLGDYG